MLLAIYTSREKRLMFVCNVKNCPTLFLSREYCSIYICLGCKPINLAINECSLLYFFSMCIAYQHICKKFRCQISFELRAVKQNWLFGWSHFKRNRAKYFDESTLDLSMSKMGVRRVFQYIYIWSIKHIKSSLYL